MLNQDMLDTARVALTYISNPDNWTRHAEARNEKGESVSALDETAHKWSLRGALVAAISRTHYERRNGFVHIFLVGALEDIIRETAEVKNIVLEHDPNHIIDKFNDDPAMLHEDIVNVLHVWIRRNKSKEVNPTDNDRYLRGAIDEGVYANRGAGSAIGLLHKFDLTEMDVEETNNFNNALQKLNSGYAEIEQALKFMADMRKDDED